MKKGFVGSSIDFSSAKSEWQINWYLWKFWDDQISTKANPSHKFKKPWKYNVTLELEFDNMNVMTDQVEIIIE
jgi:PKD repeat protein